MRQRWIRAIPRDNWLPSHRTVVCIKYFHEDDLDRLEIYKDKNDIRHIFPNLRSYLSIKSNPIRRHPDLRREQRAEKEKERLQLKKKREEQQDKLIDFNDVISQIYSKLGNDTSWQIYFTNDCCVIYKLDLSGVPKVKQSLKIRNTLEVNVYLNGDAVPCTNFTSIVPNEKIKNGVSYFCCLNFVMIMIVIQ